MCIGILATEAKKKAWLKEQSRKRYIKVYKVCKPGLTGFMLSFAKDYKPGIVKAEGAESPSANCGWHVFLDREEAHLNKWRSDECVLECYAKPGWLKAVDYGFRQAVFTHLAFPETQHSKITTREFREMYKEWRNGEHEG